MSWCCPLNKTVAFAAIALLIATPGVSGAIKVKKEAERKRAPDFELTDANGQIVRLSDHSGKVVLLDFWATWCAPCKASIPWLIQLAERYREAGLVILGISMDADGWPPVKRFMEEMHITYPILMGNKRVAYLYGDVESLPLAFFVDRDRRVAAIHLGPASRNEFEKTIKILLDDSR